jgi:NOL1/NOP2/fmu family ribosome biogenesis protein
MADQERKVRLGPSCRLVDPAPYLSILEERFGMHPAWFTERYHFFAGGRKYIYSLRRGHSIPRGPEILFSGIKFMRVAMEIPKLTTEAAVAFGFLATRNWIRLDAPDAGRYFAREEITLETSVAETCTGSGYVLICVGPVTVGTGYLFAEEGAHRLRSWFPKRWSEVVSIR